MLQVISFYQLNGCFLMSPDSFKEYREYQIFYEPSNCIVKLLLKDKAVVTDAFNLLTILQIT